MTKTKKHVLKTIPEEDSETDHSIELKEYKDLLKKIHSDISTMKIGQKSKKANFWIAPRKLKTLISEINAIKQGKFVIKK